jgi:hypothetical protein
MEGQGSQHVVEESDPGRNLGLAGAVQIQIQFNLGLFGLAMNCGLREVSAIRI